MFQSTGLAKMFAGHRKFFRGPHVRHLCFKMMQSELEDENNMLYKYLNLQEIYKFKQYKNNFWVRKYVRTDFKWPSLRKVGHI